METVQPTDSRDCPDSGNVVSNQDIRNRGTSFSLATAAFCLGIAAALVGMAPPWLGMVAGAGLLVTGLTYVASWSLDNVMPY
jgi:hypothetical protein